MCGIAGIFAYGNQSPRVEAVELLAMRDQMRMRGPDGSGLWIDASSRIGLAQRRLAIIDPSEAGAQPMLDPDTGNQIVFNGEIYNHKALAIELRREGVMLRTRSDTEVVLALYSRYGADMLRRLRGMFSIAIWDARSHELFLARDPFGIKPLFYADDGTTFRLASQVKALLKGQVDASPDPAGHAGFFLWGSVPEPFTLYRGIKAWPSGSWGVVNRRGLSAPRPFDSPLQRLKSLELATADDRTAALEHIAESIRQSIDDHTVADVPIGVFLSAGLDSTMIASHAARSGRVRTITVGFEEYAGTEYDEIELAGRVAGRLGTDHAVERYGAADFESDREALLAAMDQPSIDGVNTWFVAKSAARQGLKVALSGLGGDELFGSYPSFDQVPRIRSLVNRAGPLQRLGIGLRRLSRPFVSSVTSPKYASLFEYGGSFEGAYLLRRALYLPWEIGPLIGEDMARSGLEALATISALRRSIEGLTSARRVVSALEMQWYMKNQLLRDADWAGMAHSVEIRVPFVDTKLLGSYVELLGLGLQEEKRRIARAVAPDTPDEVLNRPKTGFIAPTRRWMIERGGERDHSLRGWARHVYSTFTGPR